MKKCPECEKEFEASSKKRIFCSNKCRQKDYRKSISEILKTAKDDKPEQNLNADDDEVVVLKKIISIERETLPKDRDTPLGRAMWQKEKSERIEELKKKIK